jgi:PAS domain S-box-containing protein
MPPVEFPEGPIGRPPETPLGLSEGLREALRATLEALPLCALMFDAEGLPLFANGRAEAWLRSLSAQDSGAGLQACASFSLPPLCDPRSERPIPADQTPLSRALRGRPSEDETYLVRRGAGPGERWIECGAQPLAGPGAAIQGALFCFRDITAQRKREFEAESANQLRDFIYRENLAGIIHATVDGRLLDCNDAILKMWGYESREELFAVRASQLYFDPVQRDRMVRLLAATGQLNEYEVCYRRKNGSRCWALINVRLIDAPRGQVGGSVVATVIDITERKIQEETLRQSEQRFSAFMSHLPGVAFIKDLNGAYVYYNEAAWTLYGVRPEDMIGQTDAEVWPEADAALFRRNDAEVVAQRKPREFVEPVAHRDGPHQLTQARKMDALGRLAGGVAHDFNNLLTVISGYGQLSLEGLGEVSEDSLAGYLREILNSARRASALTGQLLAFSRRQTVQPQVLDLSDLLGNMERLLIRLIGEHVELKVRCGGRCLIRADAHQMEQVVMNLAVNARDAMPLGGSLDIRCERLPDGSAPVNEETNSPLPILLEVRDTGIGMDEQIRPRIFDPFFTSKEQGQGAGLGLSMVYGIVSQAKGRIQVDTTPGEGTVFRIFLPEASGEAVSAAPLKPRAPEGMETVLLVEDEAAVRALARTILTRLGYRVLAAESGSDAMQIWAEKGGSIDILLTDVIMPQMSGGELAHKLREARPSLKVLFMSGYTDDMLASHGVLAGETQLIQKPFTPEGLGRKLRDVLDA